MPVASRSRTVAATPEDVWRVVGDLHHLARWWPRCERVEAVDRGRFTQVMRTKKGRPVRADFRVTEVDWGKRHSWAQEVAGTPFERFLALNETDVELMPADDGTVVTITQRQKLKGMSRVGGGVMLKRATKKQLDEALAALDGLVAG
jgi:carbon monoxide dehydrogenase subunit G